MRGGVLHFTGEGVNSMSYMVKMSQDAFPSEHETDRRSPKFKVELCDSLMDAKALALLYKDQYDRVRIFSSNETETPVLEYKHGKIHMEG